MPDDSPTQDDLLFALERELGHQSLHIHHIVVVGPLRLLNALVESLYFQTFIQRYFTFFSPSTFLEMYDSPVPFFSIKSG